MKSATAVITITLWLAALTGVVIFAYLSTQSSWRLTHPSTVVTVEPVASAAAAATLSAFDRERLTNGLASLQASLEAYQERLLGSEN